MFFNKKYETPAEIALAVGNNKTLQILLIAHCAGLDKSSRAALDNARILKNNAGIHRKRQKKLNGIYGVIAPIAPFLSVWLWKRYKASDKYHAMGLAATDLENHAASWKMFGDTLNSVSAPLLSALLSAGETELLSAQVNYSTDPDAQQDLRAAAAEVGTMLQFIDRTAKAGDNNDSNTASAATQ